VSVIEQSWVTAVAKGIGSTCRGLELDELIACGYEGLLNARRDFRRRFRVPFRVYARTRIRGAILDGIRSLQRVPRRAHARGQVCSVDIDDLAHMLRCDAPPPDELLDEFREAQLLRSVTDILPECERELIRRSYFGGERFDHVARDLGISKSWASRVHRRGLELLRNSLVQELEKGSFA
jgi:RNA polymerase sigma factor for flagellar operon FliA